MKLSLMEQEIADAKEILEKKQDKSTRSKAYYDINAKYLTKLKKGDIAIVKSEGVVKGLEWKKKAVTRINNFRSYDVILKKSRKQTEFS